MIYLQPVLQKRVLDLLNFALNPQGVLFLGSSEATGEMADYFEPLDHKWRIYRSRGRRPQTTEVSDPALRLDAIRGRSSIRLAGCDTALRVHEEERLLERLMEGIAGDYLPFTMVVSESLELLHVVGDASDHLRFPPGKVINDISKLVNKYLAIPLATGLQKVLRNKQELTYSNIYLNKPYGGKERRTVNLRLKPLSVRQGQAQLIAVFIEEVHSTPGARHARLEVYDVGREAQQRISDLENELQFTRENLQATVEELETSNEELQATNEELLASNEELQSTNEELQSVNEELYTVNSEYQRKITELTEANNDLDNLLRNTRVATLFVDENLDIRRFTPEIAEIFHIMEQDIGRPLSYLAHRMENVNVMELAAQVQTDEKPYQLDVRTMGGEHYRLRVLPYQITPKIYSGLVFSFVNVSGLRKAQSELSERETRMATLLNVIPDGYVLIDSEGRIEEFNPAICKLLGYAPEELLGENVTKLMPAEIAEQHASYISRYLGGGEPQVIGKNRRVMARHKSGFLVPLMLSVADMIVAGRYWFVGLLYPPEEK